MPPADRGWQRGFTLIEVIVVLVILALVAGLVLTRRPMRSGAVDMREASAALIGSLRLARARAIASNRPVAVRLEPGDGAFTLDDEALRRLPRGIRIVSGASVIVFRPDGSSSGGTVQLAGEAQRARVEVSWLTGRAASVPEP